MMPGPQELILILLIAVLIFGAKRIPEIMGGLGKGIKSFKKAMDGEDVTPEPQAQQPAAVTTAPAASQVVPAVEAVDATGTARK